VTKNRLEQETFRGMSRALQRTADAMDAASNFQILIVPGLYGAGPDHWQTHWENALGAQRVEQDDWAAPRGDAWAVRLDEAVRRSERRVVFVGHSLGSTLVSLWAAKQDTAKVAGAFLVAPPDMDQNTLDLAFDIAGFDPLILDRLPFPSVVVASRDDGYVKFPRAQWLAAAWGSRFIDAGCCGHIGSDARMGAWPAGFEWFKAFAASLLAAERDETEGVARMPV
jgi:hypothetical protein